MKTLYISDLDGTLLGADQSLSAESAGILRNVTSSGSFFTFATARTAESALKIMENAGVNVPCILMNGVCIYDMLREKYVLCRYIPQSEAALTAKELDRQDFGGFLYRIDSGKLSCYFTELKNNAMKEFFNTRKIRYNKNFIKVDSLSQVCDDKVVYFCVIASKDRLEPLKMTVSETPGLRYEFYGDVYDNTSWYLEVFHESASKSAGVEFLRRNYGFDRVVAFGDNYNDLPLLRSADLSFAVENAVDEVKKAADRITHIGVAAEIQRLAENQHN